MACDTLVFRIFKSSISKFLKTEFLRYKGSPKKKPKLFEFKRISYKYLNIFGQKNLAHGQK